MTGRLGAFPSVQLLTNAWASFWPLDTALAWLSIGETTEFLNTM